MTVGPITLTVGWIGRHTPPGAGVDGRDAAVIDIAQDLLLRDLHERGSLDALVFKGGTSLRKLYAGNQGRFSLDLDFSVADPSSDADTVVLELVNDIDGTTIGPFSYGVSERRGKWSLTIQSPFAAGESTLSSKLDVSPPPWLEPVRRGWVGMPIHATYGVPSLPELRWCDWRRTSPRRSRASTARRQPGIFMTLRGLSPISATLVISTPISSVEWSC
jgi:hypothetical protein